MFLVEMAEMGEKQEEAETLFTIQLENGQQQEGNTNKKAVKSPASCIPTSIFFEKVCMFESSRTTWLILLRNVNIDIRAVAVGTALMVNVNVYISKQIGG
jgi:adenine-specific DNA methylase